MKKTTLCQNAVLLAIVSLLAVSAVAPAAATNYMLFYSANTGATVSGVLEDNGTYRDLRTIPNISLGWTHVVATTKSLSR